jgi:hypothetical protein
MPVKFTLNDTKSNDTVVDRTKRLIEPLFLNIGADPIDINDIQETVELSPNLGDGRDQAAAI